jgi:hypothetical protein
MSLCETISESEKRLSNDGLKICTRWRANLRAPEAADELFALAAEHAARDDFDPAGRRIPVGDVHHARD